ncbi:hypothetical protein [Enterovirga sp. CN4-39]|uniref:hypothetical protein n=1 Tax=Enterovirga sp. CN4-39 TaxID=3400910 RepID=UPI003C09F4DB
MREVVQVYLDLELVAGKDTEFESTMRELADCVSQNSIPVVFDFYRDSAGSSEVFAVETHESERSLARYFEVAGPILERARACVRPNRVLVLGDLSQTMGATMVTMGASVVPRWLQG